MLQRARAFFAKRGVVEVDPSALVARPPLDANIDVIRAEVAPGLWGYLHTSPEYAMKRLLSSVGEEGPDLYYLGHVFRQGEIGRLHNPEFTMAEWYRKGFSFAQMIEETASFLSLFLGELPLEKISYREAFQKFTGLDPLSAPLEALRAKALPFSPPSDLDRQALRHLLLSHYVEPQLGQNGLTALIDYPADEAALATLVEKGGELVAERFELYYLGVELSNGYHELSSSTEIRRRFEHLNEGRRADGKEPYHLDEEFLSSLGSLPPCCGVSVGVDRAFMLAKRVQTLGEILPFPWSSS